MRVGDRRADQQLLHDQPAQRQHSHDRGLSRPADRPRCRRCSNGAAICRTFRAVNFSDVDSAPARVVGLLTAAREQYLAQPGVEHYDEVLYQVTEQARVDGHLGKAQIGALLFWKRLRADTPWVTRLHLRPDAEVRAVTAAAADAMNVEDDVETAARAGRSALLSLPGFQHGAALASAVLTALAPERMAIYDTRAHAGLAQLSVPTLSTRYSHYMRAVEALRQVLAVEGLEWTARDVDLALFTLGGRRWTQSPTGDE